MIDFIKLRKASYISKRMYILKNACEDLGLDIDYLFGLFNMYNVKNAGRWFWQKASFTGQLKESFDKFNSYMDKLVKELKKYDDNTILNKINESKSILEDLIKKLEVSLNVERQSDQFSVKSYLDNNLRNLIKESLKGM
jgi:hypothetical protein